MSVATTHMSQLLQMKENAAITAELLEKLEAYFKI